MACSHLNIRCSLSTTTQSDVAQNRTCANSRIDLPCPGCFHSTAPPFGRLFPAFKMQSFTQQILCAESFMIWLILLLGLPAIVISVLFKLEDWDTPIRAGPNTILLLTFWINRGKKFLGGSFAQFRAFIAAAGDMIMLICFTTHIRVARRLRLL
ncbi:hypothetical protein BD779DRAFT_1506369 [Infundibulicybe gibba]|nr:hypothetical protein BD779DRAFT_1506369 [Infundibulicybe gibba]